MSGHGPARYGPAILCRISSGNDRAPDVRKCPECELPLISGARGLSRMNQASSSSSALSSVAVSTFREPFRGILSCAEK